MPFLNGRYHHFFFFFFGWNENFNEVKSSYLQKLFFVLLMQLYLQFQHLHYYYTNLYAYNILADTYTTYTCNTLQCDTKTRTTRNTMLLRNATKNNTPYFRVNSYHTSVLKVQSIPFFMFLSVFI